MTQTWNRMIWMTYRWCHIYTLTHVASINQIFWHVFIFRFYRVGWSVKIFESCDYRRKFSETFGRKYTWHITRFQLYIWQMEKWLCSNNLWSIYVPSSNWWSRLFIGNLGHGWTRNLVSPPRNSFLLKFHDLFECDFLSFKFTLFIGQIFCSPVTKPNHRDTVNEIKSNFIKIMNF